ncbi:tRNA (adenosine(37)-N6)-dimethylallyltransferase MiaA [Flavobacteriaceae bacterium]|nr:tRNA (adenosine(37)-N6)-dimethylallyltransferase MiaA [Flavobacteriaceae bacterium]
MNDIINNLNLRSGKIIIISGPTASGKSAFGKKISQKVNGVIINADALQVYKELPFLSCQPTKIDFEEIDHLLYSFLSYDQEFSVKKWLLLAKHHIKETQKSGKTPVIVGGTGLYISSLIDGIHDIPPISEKISQDNQKLYDEIGRDGFMRKMQKMGYNMQNIYLLDKNRLIRRMNVVCETGELIEYWQSKPKVNFLKDDEFIHISLAPDRYDLYENCNLRFKNLFNNDAFEEVESLLEKDGFSDKLQIAKTIGFMEIKDYMDGKISLDDVVRIATKKTRNFAKRQITWFKNQFKDNIYRIEDRIKEF